MAPGRFALFLAACSLSPAAVAQTLLFTEVGEADGDYAGTAVAVVGDVDADGADDYAVGTPFDDTTASQAGRVRVYSGRTRLPIHTWYGGAANDRLGLRVLGAGDLDGDGHAEVVISATGGNYVDVMSGATGLPLHHLTGTGGSFGLGLATGGHLDGDGVPDLLVGAPYLGTVGALTAFSGATGLPIRTHTGTCTAYLGYSAAFLGDMDGDGLDEYAVGRTAGITGCGPMVFAYAGSTGALLWSNSTPEHTDQLGYALAPLADVTGDGIQELLAGAPQDPGVGCGPCNGFGYVRLLNGATGDTLWQVHGNSTYSGLGSALVVLGDIDGDGFEDFTVSQPESDGGGGSTQPLQIRDGLTGALHFQFGPPAPDDHFGRSLASGDVNDDGLRDLLVGAPQDDTGGLNAGAAYAYTIVRQVTPYCEAKVNSQGCTPTIWSTGVPDLTVGTFRVRALDVLNNKFGVLFWGRVPNAAPFQGGTLCVQPPLIRTPVQHSGGNPPPSDCSGTYTFHFSLDYMNPAGIVAGDQIYCQYWSRDPQDAFSTGLTAGLAFLVLP